MKSRGEMLMSQMKDSGIKWIGSIPEEWEVLKSRYFLNEISIKGYPNEEVLSLYRDYGIIPKNSRSDNHNVTSLDTSGYKFVSPGNLVINKMKAWQGSMAISNLRGIVSPAYYTFEVDNERFDLRFLHYALRNPAYKQEYRRISAGLRIGQWDLNKNEFKNLKYVYPIDKTVQKKIATFLDEKTALIDEIISDSKKSIEELKAYKQSLITEIVTKGLDPNVTLVPSGIDWIGDIPEGWEVVRSKNILSYSKGLSITKENLTETGIPVINYGQIHSKYPVYFNPKINQLPFISNVYLESKKNALLNQGDFVFADTSEDISGSGNFSSLTSDGIVFAGYHTIIARIIDKTRINFRYLAYYFSSELHRKQVGSRVSGVKVFSISQKILKSMLILLPNRDEQNSIANYLDQKTAQIDTIIAEKENLIFEFESYKKSMIYEYVTGKKQVEGYES